MSKYDIFKRILDILFSFILIIVLLPLMVIICILVRVESKGNVLYYQKRVGKDGKEFTLYKIRSMVDKAEKDGEKMTLRNDERITKIGRVIRKTRLDELPQLFNILKGDMTFVGPRPEREIFIKEIEKTIPNFRKRLEVKQGLTGLAQVSGGYDLDFEDKLKYDLYYIKNRNIILDSKIIFETIKVIITGVGAR